MRADSAKLRQRWQALCRDWGTLDSREQVFERLWSAYTHSSRHYHDISHIADCLHDLDAVRDRTTDPIAIELAIWFHDVIYNGQRRDNEEESARFADAELTRLGAPRSLCQNVCHLVLLTKHDREPDSDDGKLIADIDLASLALAPKQFDRNTELIRQEYPHLTEQQYRQGRHDLLGRFLARPRIYYTASFFNRLEQPARQNLERALAKLSKGQPG